MPALRTKLQHVPYAFANEKGHDYNTEQVLLDLSILIMLLIGHCDMQHLTFIILRTADNNWAGIIQSSIAKW